MYLIINIKVGKEAQNKNVYSKINSYIYLDSRSSTSQRQVVQSDSSAATNTVKEILHLFI
jgi:hypothetical protein